MINLLTLTAERFAHTMDELGHIIDVCHHKHGFPPVHKYSTTKHTIVNNIMTDNGEITRTITYALQHLG